MTLRHVAPAIARWGIIPSVTAFVALGAFLLVLPLRTEIRDFSNMQIVEVRKKETGEKLLAVDYYYPFGMDLVTCLQQKIREAEDGDTSHRPSC